jgi:hypothetical protein
MKFRYMLVSYFPSEDGKYNELTEFKNSLKLKSRHSAKVILDFKKKEVVKNELNSNASYTDMLEFYKKVIGPKLLTYLPS